MTEKEILIPGRWYDDLRRWLGIYTKSEKEVLAYGQRLKAFSLDIAAGRRILTERPDWIRHEDYKKLQKMQNKIKKR